jgi:hypothetical protein
MVNHILEILLSIIALARSEDSRKCYRLNEGNNNRHKSASVNARYEHLFTDSIRLDIKR